METIIQIKIKTPDNYKVYPEDQDDFQSLPEEEQKAYGDEFAKGYHEMVVKKAKSYFEKDVGDVTTILEDDVMDDLEEYFIDGWEDFEDYETEVSVESVKEE